MTKLNNVKSFSQSVLFTEAQAVSPGKLNVVLGQLRKSIEGRRAYEIKVRRVADGGSMSNDFRFVEKLDSREVALFMTVCGINPATYVNGAELSDAEFERLSGISADARTKNLKGYDKMRGAAAYFLSGGHMQAVLKTFVACSIVAHRFHDVLPRETCKRFLDSVKSLNVSEELREALESYERDDKTVNLRATHMTGGTDTQTSQCSLQLATMKAATVQRNGRFKDFALDLDSPVIESFAQRFGMVADLEKARAAQAQRDAATLAA